MEKPTLYLSRRDVMVYGLRGPTRIEIICGDCSVRTDESGNVELLPVRTLLATDDRCYTCGGRSYVIASELCAALRDTISERRKHGFPDGFGSERVGEAELEVWESPQASEVFSEATSGAKAGVDSERSTQVALHIN